MVKEKKTGLLKKYITKLHELSEKKDMNVFQEVFTAFVKSQEKALLKINKEMSKEFNEATSLRDYLILVKRWFGEK